MAGYSYMKMYYQGNFKILFNTIKITPVIPGFVSSYKLTIGR